MWLCPSDRLEISSSFNISYSNLLSLAKYNSYLIVTIVNMFNFNYLRHAYAITQKNERMKLIYDVRFNDWTRFLDVYEKYSN